jgi:hypothetical protein
MSIEEYSLSAREIRQTRRNLKRENKIVETICNLNDVPDLKVEDVEDEDEVISREYCMKENTRRIKRSHEKKEKKSAKKEVEVEIVAARPLMPEKKDNTRRARRENFYPKKSDKHVSFEEVDMVLKPFRVPSGRFTKEKKVVNEVTATKFQKRNVSIVDYYESDDDEDAEKEDDEDYEEEEDIEFQKRRRV